MAEETGLKIGLPPLVAAINNFLVAAGDIERSSLKP